MGPRNGVKFDCSRKKMWPTAVRPARHLRGIPYAKSQTMNLFHRLRIVTGDRALQRARN